MAEVLHLAKRFFGALSSRPPPSADERWALDHLSDAEAVVWAEMSPPDRRHAIGVARLVEAELTVRPLSGGRPADSCEQRSGVAAALLHDSGKVASGFGTFARVGATLVWMALPHRWATHWSGTSGLTRRLADYRRHPELGAERLAQAGSDPFVVDWTREHHQEPESWTVDRGLGDILKRCDDD